MVDTSRPSSRSCVVSMSILLVTLLENLEDNMLQSNMCRLQPLQSYRDEKGLKSRYG